MMLKFDANAYKMDEMLQSINIEIFCTSFDTY